MEENETPEVPPRILYVGARIGGEDATNAQVLAVMSEVRRVIREERLEPGPDDLSVDLVFDVPGPFYPYDGYKGVRTGRLSRARQLLQVQVAVPAGLDEARAWQFFHGALREVLELTRSYIVDHRLGYNLVPLELVIQRALERIRPQAE